MKKIQSDSAIHSFYYHLVNGRHYSRHQKQRPISLKGENYLSLPHHLVNTFSSFKIWYGHPLLPGGGLVFQAGLKALLLISHNELCKPLLLYITLKLHISLPLDQTLLQYLEPDPLGTMSSTTLNHVLLIFVSLLPRKGFITHRCSIITVAINGLRMSRRNVVGTQKDSTLEAGLRMLKIRNNVSNKWWIVWLMKRVDSDRAE